MAKYVCSVCGYTYDEAKGVPWDELPVNWVCPLCGASKSEFKREGESAAAAPAGFDPDELKELAPLEAAALCSNLAKGCQKQYMAEEAALFAQLAEYYAAGMQPYKNPGYNELARLAGADIDALIPAASAAAKEKGDRGALRALVWCEKATRMLRSLLERFAREGDGMLEGTGVYVCTICGYIYIGNDPPAVCPVCKVPNWKFEKIEGRAM